MVSFAFSSITLFLTSETPKPAMTQFQPSLTSPNDHYKQVACLMGARQILRSPSCCSLSATSAQGLTTAASGGAVQTVSSCLHSSTLPCRSWLFLLLMMCEGSSNDSAAVVCPATMLTALSLVPSMGHRICSKRLQCCIMFCCWH